MSLPLFFQENIDDQAFSLTLNEDSSRHIVQVLRMKKGEHIQLTDGKGILLTAEITDDHKKKCRVQRIVLENIPSPSRKISIGISLLKNASRFEWFLEKATEIGVTSIQPLLCSRTEKQHFRFDRMKGILISAMLQSHQSWLPELLEPAVFEKCIAADNSEAKFIAHCENDAEKKSLHTFSKHDTSIILIGPEGDFTPAEIALALENKYVPVSLGDNRLRTETAGMVAVTMMNI